MCKASLRRSSPVLWQTYRRQRIDTPDGDFIDFDWLEGASNASAPLVVLFHGLEGSASSHYAAALMHRVRTLGWRGVIPHFRGCSGEPNRLPRAYHSGDYAEVGWMLARIRELVPGVPLYAAGVSARRQRIAQLARSRTGARGRAGHRRRGRVHAARSHAAGIAIEQGFSRLYSRLFQLTLLPKALIMARALPRHARCGRHSPGRLDVCLRRRRDRALAWICQHGGLLDACEQQPWLKGIVVPTLVLNALNDPFIPRIHCRAKSGSRTRRAARTTRARWPRRLSRVAVSRQFGLAASATDTILRTATIVRSGRAAIDAPLDSRPSGIGRSTIAAASTKTSGLPFPMQLAGEMPQPLTISAASSEKR